MPRLNITKEQAIAVLPVIQAPNGSNKVISLEVKKSKRIFKKGDKLFLYFKNYTNRWERLGVVECKQAAMDEDGLQHLGLKNTYDRRYYLNRRVKKAGYSLDLAETTRTIQVPASKVEEAMKNKDLKELGRIYNYGIQLVMDC